MLKNAEALARVRAGLSVKVFKMGPSRPCVREARPAICEKIADTPRKVERNGTTYTQNTANIGKRPLAFQPAPPCAAHLWCGTIRTGALGLPSCQPWAARPREHRPSP